MTFILAVGKALLTAGRVRKVIYRSPDLHAAMTSQAHFSSLSEHVKKREAEASFQARD